jgi:Cu+-exporting ATPase
MEVDPQEAAGTSIYRGVTYYFCSLACKKEFDANPTKLLMQK